MRTENSDTGTKIDKFSQRLKFVKVWVLCPLKGLIYRWLDFYDMGPFGEVLKL